MIDEEHTQQYTYLRTTQQYTPRTTHEVEEEVIATDGDMYALVLLLYFSLSARRKADHLMPRSPTSFYAATMVVVCQNDRDKVII